jgi:hypothetical protein
MHCGTILYEEPQNIVHFHKHKHLHLTIKFGIPILILGVILITLCIYNPFKEKLVSSEPKTEQNIIYHNDTTTKVVTETVIIKQESNTKNDSSTTILQAPVAQYNVVIKDYNDAIIQVETITQQKFGSMCISDFKYTPVEYENYEFEGFVTDKYQWALGHNEIDPMNIMFDNRKYNEPIYTLNENNMCHIETIVYKDLILYPIYKRTFKIKRIYYRPKNPTTADGVIEKWYKYDQYYDWPELPEQIDSGLSGYICKPIAVFYHPVTNNIIEKLYINDDTPFDIYYGVQTTRR